LPLRSNFFKEKKTTCASPKQVSNRVKKVPSQKIISLGSSNFCLGNNIFSPGKGPSSSKKNVLNLFVITIISCLFLYCFITYHWKGFEKIYNFIVGNISIKIHMQNLRSKKISNTFVPHETWLLPHAT
jgi:hypothetical protein